MGSLKECWNKLNLQPKVNDCKQFSISLEAETWQAWQSTLYLRVEHTLP